MTSPEDILKQQLYLRDIGTSLKDFKEVNNKGKIYSILGYGNFAYVEKMLGKDNKYYAVKKIDKHSPKFNKQNFKRETQISIKLNHENLVRFYGYFEDKEKIEKFKEIKVENIIKSNNKFKEDIILIKNEREDKDIYCLVREFCQNGSLEDFIKKYKTDCKYKGGFVPLDQDIVIKFLEQILNALKYLHNKKIAHRDIIPDNILLDENNNIKISIPGIVAIFKEEGDTKNEEDEDLLSHCTRVGRRHFVCPEIEHSKKYDCRCDIYSLGLTMLCLMLEDRPFAFNRDPYNKQIISRVFKDGIWDKLNCYNKYLVKLIKRMLEEDINYRPTSNQCYDELEYIKLIIKYPNDTVAEKYLQNKNDPEKRVSNRIKIIIPKPKNNDYKEIPAQQYNHINNNNICNNNNAYNNNNSYYNNNFYNNNNSYINNNIYNNNNTYINNNAYNNNNIYYNNNNTYQQVYNNVNPLYQPYYNNQGYITNYPNCNQNNLINNSYIYQNPNNQIYSKNSSIASVIQCLYYCFKGNELHNFKFFIHDNRLFSYDIVTLIEKVNIEKQVTFLNSIQNFRNKASQLIPKFKGTEEIDPIFAFFGICSYINKEFRENNNFCPNLIYNEFIDVMKEIPKANFPKVYETIDSFKEQYHSPFVNNFYSILLNLIKCPKCNCVLNAEIKNDYGVSSFIPLNGSIVDKVSNLFEIYMSKLIDSQYHYNCKNCDYKGLGKDKSGFLNAPKFLLFSFEGEKVIKILDDQIDLTNYILAKSKNNKYNLLSFIAKENNKYKAYIKNDIGIWCAYNEENIIEENSSMLQNNCIPYIAIYKKEA